MPAELSMRAVAALPPRRQPYWVAPNLYVSKVSPPGFWLMMYASPLQGRRVEMGLGSIAVIPLAQVKTEVLEYRAQIARGRCPLTERQAEQAARKADRPIRNPHTFRAVAELYIEAHRSSWSNPKHARQWPSTLQTYVYPVIGDLPMSRVDVGEVLQILEKIWRSKPETASRVRGRIETVWDYAKARGWAHGENPARWRGHLAQLLPARAKVQPVRHQAALPWRQLPAFYQRLAHDTDISALALRYTIAGALRTGETRLTTVSEIDRKHLVHVIPAEHTKSRRLLRVPLSREAVAILDQAEEMRSSNYIFGGARLGKPLSDMAMLMKVRGLVASVTVHGFRSCFRDWASETHIPAELAERALGHVVEDATERAYLRTDALEARRPVMQAWVDFLTNGTVG
jgi:integrase